MKIAVTGATGFIGQYVRNALAQTDHEVVLLVRDSSKVGERYKSEQLVEDDLSHDRTDWFEFLGKPEAVIHLAWGGLGNYLDTYHVEIEMPTHLKFLKSLINSGLKKLVVSGTCYEYGPSSGAVSESQTTNPNTPYGSAKDSLRKALFEIQSEHDFDLTWVRIFYPYGDGQSIDSLYSSIKKALYSKESNFVVRSGDSILDFISVSDVGQMLVWFTINTSFVGVVNLGSGNPTSVFDFVQGQATRHSWHFNIQSNPATARLYESKSFWANTDKLVKLLAATNVVTD